MNKCDCEPFASCPICRAQPKPGLKEKSTKIHNKRGRTHDIDKPETLYCRACKSTTGTECWRHAEVPWLKWAFGSGTGAKVDDNLTAWLCMDCDSVYSKKPEKDASLLELAEYDVKWLTVIILSHLL